MDASIDAATLRQSIGSNAPPEIHTWNPAAYR